MKFVKAVAVLIGTVVGAGIFGLPYVIAQVGFMVGLGYLCLFAAIFLIVNLCYGELILRTRGNLEMPGFAKKYLGSWGKLLITLSLMIGIYGAMVAYTIGVGGFLKELLGPLLGGSQILWSIVFWGIASFIIYKGVGIVSSIETFMAIALIFVVLFIVSLAFPFINNENLEFIDLSKIFLPYGVILFAFGGASAVPTMRRILKNQEEKLKLAIILGSTIPLLIYIIFSFAVVGVTGIFTTETAILGLGQAINGGILLIGGIFGVLAMTTSFLALGHILRELWHRDYNFPLLPAWVITVTIPLFLFIGGLKSFVKVLGISGGILSGVQGVVLLLAYYKSKKLGTRIPEFKIFLPKFLSYIFYVLFIIGIIYQIINI
ncbi:MAG TPA: aromatic amino acid transport family protein [Patescibacteria group bacterium]|nr:aromatic amino acid transport family protein [Patescibacteria group bacterium]